MPAPRGFACPKHTYEELKRCPPAAWPRSRSQWALELERYVVDVDDMLSGLMPAEVRGLEVAEVRGLEVAEVKGLELYACECNGLCSRCTH